MLGPIFMSEVRGAPSCKISKFSIRQMDRQTDKQTNVQTDKQMDRQIKCTDK